MPEHPHHIRSEAYKYRFDLLFASLLCTIVVNIFFPEDIYDGIAQTIYLPIQLIAGISLFDIRRKGYLLTLLIFLGGLLIVGRLLDSFTPLNLREYLVFAYVVFFGWVTLELFRQIYTAPLVDRESVLAALCGLLLIGYCGFFVFVAVEFHQPGSFSGLTPGGQGFRDLFYFSYVTILTIGYGDFVLLKDLNFNINRGDVFIIMGGSGCGKSSMLRVLTGLVAPQKGTVVIDGTDFTKAAPAVRDEIMRRSGILYQSGALFSSMTLAENIALPLEQYTGYSEREISELVSLKLALVGLAGFEDFYPSEISGGMKKRAGLARALALDPEIVYFDEPSAGLDPVSSRLLDDLILDINHNLGTTIVIVTHELASIFAVGSNSVFLDGETKSIQGYGNPRELLKNPPNEKVYNFLTRGGSEHA